MVAFRRFRTSGIRKSSRKDSWLAARMTGPSSGMFSRPIALGRYKRRRTGPRGTYFSSHQNAASPSPRGPPPVGPGHVVRLYGPKLGGKRIHMLAFGPLEWTFLVVLVVLVGAAGAFALFLVAQLFRTH